MDGIVDLYDSFSSVEAGSFSAGIHCSSLSERTKPASANPVIASEILSRVLAGITTETYTCKSMIVHYGRGNVPAQDSHMDRCTTGLSRKDF